MHDGDVRRAAILTATTAVAVVLLAVTLARFGAQSVVFAFAVVWIPMTWLGTASRVITPRLPDWYHDLRSFECDGRIYALLGVRLFKALLRRGPMAIFNPDLHLPSEPTTTSLAQLDQRMRDAEASHVILLVATLAVVGHAVVRGWWSAAGLTLVFNILLNGYPVILQRYNRALLVVRFGTQVTSGAGSERRML